MASNDIEFFGSTGIGVAYLQEALSLWQGLECAQLELINHTENATFLAILPDQTKRILRVHRPGYNTLEAIHSELSWSKALREDTELVTPNPIAGKNGAWVQSALLGGEDEQYLVLFEFEEGREPREDEDLSAYFEQLGRMAAMTHNHVEHWDKPAEFVRLVWTEDRILDADGLWGDWRNAPGMTEDYLPLFTRLDAKLRQQLTTYGRDKNRFGLIHADMRLANLLVDGDTIKLIDFDDCGFCWFMYDFAAAISFIEDSPQIPELKRRWLKGYRAVRALSEADEREIDSFIMLRRMALTAWIGSHAETPFAASLAPHFVRDGARLAEQYLAEFA